MKESSDFHRARLEELTSALRRRFPAAVAGRAGSVPSRPTGISVFDGLLPGGGLPLGRVSLLCGPLSSGRTSLALAVAARAAEDGRPIGWIDTPGTFHPPSAAEAGLDLDRVLLVQPPHGDVKEALHAAVLLLKSGALALLVLDLGMTRGSAERAPAVQDDAAARLGHSVPGATLCLCLSDASPPPALFRIATLTIRLDRRACLFSGVEPPARSALPSLGGMAILATILRSRLGGEGRSAELSLKRGGSAGGSPDS